jgi:hypothetical protein
MQNTELEIVKDLSKRPLAGSHSTAITNNTCHVSDMVIVVELEDVLRNPDRYPTADVSVALQRLTEEVKTHMAHSKSVVVRGWRRDLRYDFSPLALQLHVGDLGQRAQWLEGFQFAKNRDRDEKDRDEYHKSTTLNEFIAEMANPDLCGNWLDSNNLHPNPPSFIPPLLDSTKAWNETYHLRFYSNGLKKYNITYDGPAALRSSNWSSAGWRLITHPGFVTHPHHDCCGFGTYVVAEAGCKMWGVMRPKVERCGQPMRNLFTEFERMVDLIGGVGYDCDVVTVCLEENDVM